MQNTQSPYYCHIMSEALHQQVDELVTYLNVFPFEVPVCCYYCGSHRFNLSGKRKDGIKSYSCLSCQKSFNAFTGTVFARCWHPDKWGRFAYLAFSGYSYFEMARQLGFSVHAIVIRNEKLLEYLKEHYPRLYEWRLGSLSRGGVLEPAHVTKQKQILLAWLNQRVDPETIDCPVCGNTCRKSTYKTYLYHCRHCKKQCSAFKGTLFHDKMKENRHVWLKYVAYFCDGMTHYDIASILAIHPESSRNWGDVFLALMDQLGLESLKYWTLWQHDLGRRESMVAIHNKRLGKA